MKVSRKNVVSMFTAILCIFTMCLPVYAAAVQDEGLIVDGVDAFSNTSGEGWSFDISTNTLILDGYNGGPIISHCNMAIKLKKNSVNKIVADKGVALGNEVEFGTNYTMNIVGEENSVLNIEGNRHAIHVVGNLSISNCSIVASNTVSDEDCIQSENNLTINNSNISIEQCGIGLECFNSLTISESKIDIVKASTCGVQANNKNLDIQNSEFNINSDLIGLQSQFGTVKLNNCIGSIQAYVCISVEQYIHNSKATETTDIINCDLDIKAGKEKYFGILAYSTLNISSNDDTKSIDFIDEYKNGTGLYALIQTNILDKTVINGTDNYITIRAVNGYSKDKSATVNGFVYANEGQESVDIILDGDINYIGSLNLDNKSLTIEKDATLTIPDKSSFDTSKAKQFINKGTILNNGQLVINGDISTNEGSILNNGVIIENENTIIDNKGKIETPCTNIFEVKENDLILVHNWNDGVITQKPTTSKEGIMIYTCLNDNNHTKKETIDILQPADYSKVDAIISKINLLDKNNYKNYSSLQKVIATVERDKSVEEQAEVDKYALALEKAISELEYKEVDYTRVNKALQTVKTLNKADYVDFSEVEKAVANVVEGKKIIEQDEVDKYALALEKAISELEYKEADYTRVNKALQTVKTLNKADYVDFSEVEKAVANVVEGKKIIEQDEVDKYALALEKAISELEYKEADYTRVNKALQTVKTLNKADYVDFSEVEKAVANVVEGKKIIEQDEVDKYALALEKAISELEYKEADYTRVNKALQTVKTLNKADYVDFSEVEKAVANVVEGKKIIEQAEVDKYALAIEEAIKNLELKIVDNEKDPVINVTEEKNQPVNKDKENNQFQQKTVSQVKTSDESQLMLWFGILLAVGGYGFIYSRRSKKTVE